MVQYWKTIPPLKSLLAVEAVARLRSFTRAGEELNISQSAVSHAVTLAESFLETRLFDRDVRPVTLTQEGTEFAASVSTCLAQLSADATALRHRSRTDTLTISSNLANGNYWLLPRLKAFHETHPEIQVNMVTSFHGLASLDSGVDVAIRFGRGQWPGFQSHLLFREQILPVASPGYVAQNGTASTHAELLTHTLLHAHTTDRSWYDWSQWFGYFGVKQPGTLSGPTFDNHLMMMQAALSGRGVALGWIGTATDFLKERQLVPVFDTPVLLEEGLYAVVRDSKDARISAFLEWVRSHSDTPFKTLAAEYWDERHL